VIAGLAVAVCQAPFDLWTDAVDQDDTDTEGGKQGDIVNETGEPRVLDRLTGKADDERTPTMGMDVRRRVAEPRNVLLIVAQGGL